MPAVLIVNKENGDGLEYKKIRGKYLVPVHALAKIFRAKFVKMVREKFGDTIQFPEAIWKKPWVVFCKPTIKGAANVIKYLSRYLYRVAITNSRIVAVQNGKVTFKYRNNENFKWKTLTLNATEFIRRFLQHVLPKGFHKIRYYGFLAPSSRHIFLSLKYLLFQKSPINQLQKPDFFSSKQDWRICPVCKRGNMVLILSVFSRKPYLYIARPPP